MTATVGIGLPVRNGEAHVRDAIESILAQTYTDFELVICDNNSTDETLRIATQYAVDPRVRVLTSETDIGAAANFNKAFQSTDTPLFMWVAHDDGFEPGFLAAAAHALDSDPGCGICVSSIKVVGPQGEVIKSLTEDGDLASPKVGKRAWSFLRREEWLMLYGLARREVLQHTSLYRPVWGGDVLLIWELILSTRFATIPEPLFQYRLDVGKTVEGMLSGVLPSSKHADARNAYSDLWKGLWSQVASSPIGSSSKFWIRCELLLVRLSKLWRARIFEDRRLDLDFARQHGSRVDYFKAALSMLFLRPREVWRGIRIRV